MVWTANKPDTTTKIRNGPGFITANWEAIETASASDASVDKLKYWALNLISRSVIPSAPPPDAPTITDGMNVFSKADSDTGLPELFITHSDATVTQMTKGPANIAPVGFASNGETSLPGGLQVKYALTPAALAGSNAYLWTGGGANQLGLSDFYNNAFSVFITPFRATAGLTRDQCYITAYSVTGFTIQNTYTTGQGVQFFVVAIGN